VVWQQRVAESMCVETQHHLKRGARGRELTDDGLCRKSYEAMMDVTETGVPAFRKYQCEGYHMHRTQYQAQTSVEGCPKIPINIK